MTQMQLAVCAEVDVEGRTEGGEKSLKISLKNLTDVLWKPLRYSEVKGNQLTEI